MKREPIELTPREWSDFHDIRTEAHAWRFWQSAARDRGLDWQSLYSTDGTVQKMTGLPLNHEKHWCWPSPLKCKHNPRAAHTADKP